MKFLISKEDLQKIADYLVTKPWVEVNGLIQILGALKSAPEEKAVDTKKPESSDNKQ